MTWTEDDYRSYRREYYLKNRERMREQGKAYYQKNREAILRKCRDRRKAKRIQQCPHCMMQINPQ